MKLTFLVGAATGYVLGARAGRERYEAIVRASRKVAGSQTFQSTAGVLQAQVDDLTSKARAVLGSKLPGGHASSTPASGANGFKH
jgi:hypothetical protein